MMMMMEKEEEMMILLEGGTETIRGAGIQSVHMDEYHQVQYILELTIVFL
jgi:hypothetical protein